MNTVQGSVPAAYVRFQSYCAIFIVFSCLRSHRARPDQIEWTDAWTDVQIS